ncbi:bacterio-opsin activator domain-containing protein [Natronomonas sp.]|uniref:bacterio-opsin activator domain-containing protein n=1 Tax=Natronomonas sp. TaxID=2184060 RepID=UPI002FC27960
MTTENATGRERRGVGANVLFLSERPSDWQEQRAELERHDDISVRTATLAGVEEALADADCVVGTHGPGTDGFRAFERVRQVDGTVPFVLLAHDETGMVASRAVEAGVSGFVPVSAPNAGRLLVERVEAAIESTRRDDGVRMPIEELDIHEELRLKERAIDEAPIGITISDPDRPDNPMVYINDAFERLTGYEKANTVGQNCRFLQGPESDPEAIATMREAIDAGEPTSVELLNYRKDGDPFWNRVDIAPVRNDEGEITNFVGFQTDITDRKEAEMEAKRRREELEHLLVRIDGLLQDVTRSLVEAESRAEIERSVCERVAAADPYAFGWVGRPDLASDTLVVSARAGAPTPPTGALERDLTDETDPTVAAYETGTVQTVTDADRLAALDTPLFDGETPKGLAAIPFVYGETVYAVLTLYTDEPGALSQHETDLLAALGRASGTAINALERGRILASDSVTELELRAEDEDLFFVELSAETGCYLDYRGSVFREDGIVVTFFVTDMAVDAILDAAEAYPDIVSATAIHEYDDEALIEFRTSNGSLVSTLAERGARIDAIHVADGVADIVIELPDGGEARSIVDSIETHYPNISVVANRERERPPATKQGFIAEVENRLTERQLTALRRAHVSDYYEWNRPVTGEDLATAMGIDRSTYHQHLRAAERKLVDAFLDR